MTHKMSVMCLQVCLMQSHDTKESKDCPFYPIGSFFLSFLRARNRIVITYYRVTLRSKTKVEFENCYTWSSWWEESIAAFLVWIGAILTTLRSLLQSLDRVGPWGPAIWVIWPSPIQDDPEFLLSPSPKSKISGPQRALFVGEKMHS